MLSLFLVVFFLARTRVERSMERHGEFSFNFTQGPAAS